ncbi:MAG: DUF378 domain-containing protein [Candidatus Absconditabacterales bacterium]|jgi:uncharacterized membrane protein YuzA (DUF378 family)
MKFFYRLFLILLVIGGLNRGLFAWFDMNLVAKIFPDVSTTVMANGVETTTTTMNLIAKIVYSLVTVGALRTLIANFGCKCCKQ